MYIFAGFLIIIQFVSAFLSFVYIYCNIRTSGGENPSCKSCLLLQIYHVHTCIQVCLTTATQSKTATDKRESP